MSKVSPARLSKLNQFASTVWGNPQALRRHLGPQNVEYIDLGEHFKVFQSLSSRILRHEKIIIRHEYDLVLQALQTEEYAEGVYVTGQPGIGKTYFLFYALVHFLGERQPVVLHDLGGDEIYFLFKDNVTFHHIRDSDPLDECDFVWALSDSNAYVQIPPSIFHGDTSRIRVIQTTLPKASRYKEWSKQHGVSCYIMDIWTEKEVENLATLMELDVERMTALAKKWGTVPRSLLKYFNTADEDTKQLYRSLARKAVTDCRVIMDDALQLDLSSGGPSPFYFIRPLKTVTGDVKRQLPSVTVPTRTLCEILGEELRFRSNQDKLEFYNTLSEYGGTRQAIGCIYESWFHSFILAGREVHCEWIARGSTPKRLPTTIRGTDSLILTTLTALTTSQPPYYLIPSQLNFPGIDSVLVLERDIFAFQITLSARHRPPMDGLTKLRNHLPSDLKTKARWRVVFVGAERNSIKRVAEQWTGKLHFPTERMRVPVAWSEVDPIQVDIPYKAHRDEEMTQVDPE